MQSKQLLKTLIASVFLVSLSASAAEVFEPRKIETDLWYSPHFRRAHPDLDHRLSGKSFLEDGRVKRAIREFQVAASWGDKISQAMLAEVYWEGVDAPKDRARAYAWMDLAAERQFVAFVAKRERYWAQLSEDERAQALIIGQQLYEANGDEAALARLDEHLRRERSDSGSRTGYAGSGNVVLPTAGGGRVSVRAPTSAVGMIRTETGFVTPRGSSSMGMLSSSGGRQIPLTAYYAKEFWQIEAYLDWHADQLELARRGVVRVGSVDTDVSN